MSGGKPKAYVTIFGEPHVVIGSTNPGHIEGLAATVDRKMRLISQRNPRLSTYKVAVLAALNLADELTKLKEEHQTLVELLDEDR
jgi:cell division protein ZapA